MKTNLEMSRDRLEFLSELVYYILIKLILMNK